MRKSFAVLLSFLILISLFSLFLPSFVPSVQASTTTSFTSSNSDGYLRASALRYPLPVNSPSAQSGSWTNPTNAYADSGGYAESSVNGQQHVYSGYGFSVDTAAILLTVRVRMDIFATTDDKIKLEVSSDGGSSWLATSYTSPALSTVETVYWVNVTTWDAWTWSKINSDMIQARVTQVKNGGQDTTKLDWIPIEINYDNYPVIRKQATATSIYAGNNTQRVGQLYITSTVYISRSFLYFNTSTIPDSTIINSAKLRLYGITDGSTVDFNLTVLSGQPTYPHDPLVTSDFDRTFYLGDGGNYDTSSGWSTVAYNNITLNSDGKSWINKTGVTKLNIQSSLDIASSAPTGNQYVDYAPSEYPEAKRPLLEVVYTSPPQASSISASTTIIGRKPTFKACWTGSSLYGYVFSWNNSGSWQNRTWTDPWSGTPNNGWSNVTTWSTGNYLELTTVPNTVVGWRIYVNDTNGWGDTGIQTLTTKVLDLSSEKTLYLQTSSVDTSNPNVWVTVGISVDFRSVANGYVTFDNPNERGKWLFFDNVYTSAYGQIRAYEVQYYNGTKWKSPTTVNSTSPSWQNPSNSIDNNTATFANENTMGDHDATFNTAYEDIQQIRVYKTDMYSNWTVDTIKIGKPSGWDYSGSTPWINQTDSNYAYTTHTNRLMTNFTIQDGSDSSTILGNLTAHINATGNGSASNFIVGYYDGSTWTNSTTVTTSTGWSVKTVSLTRLWWSRIYLDALKIRLFSASSSVTEIHIDKFWITYYAMTQDNMTQWVFDNAVMSRMINDSFPLVRSYYEYGQTYRLATPELLGAASYYANFGNETYLTYANKYLQWLNGTSIARLWQDYNATSGAWKGSASLITGDEIYHYWILGMRLQRLAMCVARNTTFLPLLQTAVNNYTAMFFPNDGNPRPYHYVFLNGTLVPAVYYGVPRLLIEQYGMVVDALVYTGAVLNNETIMDMAKDMALAYTLSPFNLPYHEIYRNGTEAPDYSYCKQYSAGYYLLAFNSVYFWTGNTTVKDRINTVAQYVATAFWNTTLGRFVYRVEDSDNPPPPLGTGVQNTYAEKTMPVLHDSLMVSYLIWSNETWLSKLKQSWDKYIGAGQGLTNDLLTHQGNPSWESDPFSYGSTSRIAVIYYNLNRSGWYHNGTYMTNLRRLYGATSNAHMEHLGLVAYQNASTYSWWLSAYEGEKSDRELIDVLRFLVNKTDKTINNFDDYWEYFGDPITGEVPPILVTWTDVSANTTVAGDPVQFHVKWRISRTTYLSKWVFYSNNTGSFINSSWVSFPTSVRDAYSRYNTTLNSSGVRLIQYKFYCNDTGGTQAATTLQNLFIPVNFVSTLNQSMPFTLNFIAQATLNAIFTQFISTTWLTENLRSIQATLSQSITSTWNILPGVAREISMSFSFATAWTVEALAIIFIELSQSISTAWTLLLQWDAVVTIPQTLSTTWNMLTQWTASTNLSQSFSTSLSVTSIIEIVINLSQTISTSWTLLIQWTANTNFTQTLTTTWTTLAQATYNIGTSFSLSTSWAVDIIQGLARYADLSFSFTISASVSLVIHLLSEVDAGLAIGGVAFVLVIVVLGLVLSRNKRSRKDVIDR